MQILLDAERYDLLDQEARETGRSVAAIVREAIDLRFATGHTKRAEAGRRLIADFTDDGANEPDWHDSKIALAEELDSKLP